ncbi:SEFIR domain-containing protein [Salinimicrobium catena]|uniref:SEFIR domain-containing protein n=1 Tax=Salinimicrobium catena TaxID=390640 RepID=UPI002FE462CB
MKKEDVENKEDYVNYILLELYKKVHPVDFGNLFMELMPTSGIDNFRDLLDELHENQLVTKKSEPNGHIQGMPHLVKLDLRYGISLKGIEHLKRNNILENKKMKLKDVFVTYSWDDEEHNDKVISFTNFLRDKGFEAEVDKLMSQKESATDFNKMMHQAMTDYKKVIVVLSKGYKEKATDFRGGVGNEYNLIIKDIEQSKNKYILVSFGKISDDITPLYFKGRQIIDLSIKENMNDLFSKLMDEEIIEFSEVAKNKPQVNKKVIPPFEIKEKKIQIVDLIPRFESASQFSKLLTKIEYDLSVELKNETEEIFEDYNIEVHYPQNSTQYDVDGRIENNYKVVVYEDNPKVFPQQSKSVELHKILIRNYTATEILNNNLKVKIFSKNGVVEKEFELSEILTFNSDFGSENLTIDKFQDKNYR